MLARALSLLLLTAACTRELSETGPPRCEQLCMHWQLHAQFNTLLGAPSPHARHGEHCICVPEVWDSSRYAR